MKIESGLLYSKNDEWVRIEGDTAVIGITDYAQGQLSDIVFAEVSIGEGEDVEAGDCIGTVESVKAASDIYTPVSGTIADINEAIAEEPELINKDAFAAWFVKVTLDGDVDVSELMDAVEYEQYCAEREH